MEKKNETNFAGALGALLLISWVALWGAAATIAPLAILKLCWLYLFG